MAVDYLLNIYQTIRKAKNFIRLIFSSLPSSYFHGEVAKKAVYFTSSNVFYISDFTVILSIAHAHWVVTIVTMCNYG